MSDSESESEILTPEEIAHMAVGAMAEWYIDRPVIDCNAAVRMIAHLIERERNRRAVKVSPAAMAWASEQLPLIEEERRNGTRSMPWAEFRRRVEERLAPTIEARSDETEGLGPEGESVTDEGRGAR